MNLLFNDEDNDEDNDDHDDDNGGGGGDGVFFSSAFSCVSSTIMPQRFKAKLPKSQTLQRTMPGLQTQGTAFSI